jgi:pyrroline-5-carboxylate reductase
MAVRLVLMGGGRMGEALLEGLFAAKWAAPEEVLVVEPVAARRDELAARYAGLRVDTQPAAADGAIVAVKPNDVEAACRSLGETKPGRVLSIAAGVPLATLESALAVDGLPVVRAMPNTPALVGTGAAAIAGGTSAGDDDQLHVRTLTRTGRGAARGTSDHTRTSPNGCGPSCPSGRRHPTELAAATARWNDMK